MGQDLQVGALLWSITIGLIVVLLAVDLEFILAFIGVKLILHWTHVDLDARVPAIPTAVSSTPADRE
jgi:tellurite resistance protein TerC